MVDVSGEAIRGRKHSILNHSQFVNISYSLDLKCSPKAYVVKAWSPAGRYGEVVDNFRNLVRSQVVEDVPLRTGWDPFLSVFLSFTSLP
jgi:hypothetical protein